MLEMGMWGRETLPLDERGPGGDSWALFVAESLGSTGGTDLPLGTAGLALPNVRCTPPPATSPGS